ncbi:methyltransferase domain-containing protein [Rubrivivax sp. RP6-9]|uniref:methyltransferase domain-containing protein n=1 Tax=Rubrivivax sp. RP6-9 TaxID=3415750 RepID=UPI003CC55D3C
MRIKPDATLAVAVFRAVAGGAAPAVPQATRAASARLGTGVLAAGAGVGGALPMRMPERPQQQARLLSSRAGDDDGSHPPREAAPHPMVRKLAALYSDTGARKEAEVKPLSMTSYASPNQRELFTPGSPVQARFDALLQQARREGETFRTVSVGCGRPGYDLAHMAVQLSQAGGVRAEILGFDIDEASIADTTRQVERLASDPQVPAAAAEKLRSIQVVHSDFSQWQSEFPESAGSVHAITCANTTPYLDDGQLAANLAAMHAALQPGGVLVIDGYGKQHATGGLPMHLRDAGALEAEALRAGFRLMKESVSEVHAPWHTVTVFLEKAA